MDNLARNRRQLIVKAAGLAAVLGAYMVFISRRARKQTPMISIGRRLDVVRQANLRYIYISFYRHKLPKSAENEKSPILSFV